MHALPATQSQAVTDIGGRARPPLIRLPSPSIWRPMYLRVGKPGRLSLPRPFSVPHRPSKAETAICPGGITIIGGCPRAATRCGRHCITSIVALQMVRRQRLGFSGGGLWKLFNFQSLLAGACPSSPDACPRTLMPSSASDVQRSWPTRRHLVACQRFLPPTHRA